MLKVGIRSPTQLLLSLLDESPSHPRNTMPSSVASLIATPSDCLSTTLTRQMFLTFSHPSLSGNSLTRTGRTLAAPGGSFGRTTPSSLHSPPSVSATTTVITLQSLKTSRSTFKMSSLKSLTTIEISSSFTKLCLLQSIIATKLCVGSSPITSIDFSRNVVTQRITTALELAYQVAQGKSPPVSDSNLKKDCGHRIPYIVYSKRKPAIPNLEADFPPFPGSAATPAKAPPHIPAAKARQSAAALVTQSFPPPPTYTSEEVQVPTVVTTAALPETAAPSHFSSMLSPMTPPLPGAQDDMVVDPPDPSLPASGVDVPMSSGADGPAADMEAEAATLLEPPPLKIQALRPTVHPPQPRPTEKKIDRPNFKKPAFSCSQRPFVLFLPCSPAFGGSDTPAGKSLRGFSLPWSQKRLPPSLLQPMLLLPLFQTHLSRLWLTALWI